MHAPQMDAPLLRLKSQIFSNNLAETAETMHACLHEILKNYSHSNMIIFTRLLEMQLQTELRPESQKMLRIVDLVKFPVKKSVV